MIEHSGASYGYLAEKLRFPDKHASVIVLCNRRDGPYVELSNQAADLVLGLSPTSQLSMPQAAGSAIGLERFAGLYFSDTAADGVLLEIKDGALVDRGAERDFRQTDPSSFVSSTAGTLCRCSTTYRFHTSPTGAVLGFESIRPAGVGGVIESSYRRMPPDKQPRLAGYTGEYVSDEVGAAWCVLERDAQLFVRRRGFQDRALHMLWKDAAAGPSGILQFERNAKGISGFRLRNSRINAIEFRKLPPGGHAVPNQWTCGSTAVR
jgi:hypothetical protein